MPSDRLSQLGDSRWTPLLLIPEQYLVVDSVRSSFISRASALQLHRNDWNPDFMRSESPESHRPHQVHSSGPH